MNENANESNNSTLSILVVDDDELNRRMMQLLLKREGHSTQCVSNGQEAFDAVKNGFFDMVLMDLQMPVMDGVEASRRIREWEDGTKHTYIVALTASYLPERDHLRNILQYGVENRTANQAQITSDVPVINPQITHTLDPELGIKRVGGDAEIYKEFLQEFIDELPNKLEIMKTCAKDSDAEGLGRAAHNLKGVAGNLGALQLSDHAQRLEKEVTEGYTDKVENMLNEVMKVSDGLKNSIAEYLSGKTQISPT